MPKRVLEKDLGKDRIPHWEGPSNEISLGGDGVYGVIILKRPDGRQALVLNGSGNIFAGDDDETGNVVIKDQKGSDIISIDGGRGLIIFGGNGKHGGMVLRNKQGRQTFDLNGGGSNVLIRDRNGNVIITIDGSRGDIIVGGGGRYGSISLREPKERRIFSLPQAEISEQEVMVRTVI